MYTSDSGSYLYNYKHLPPELSMALSSPFSLASSQHLSQFSSSNLKWNQKKFEFLKPQGRKFKSVWVISSVLNGNRPPSVSDSGANQPDRVILEKLFRKAQKLEERIGHSPEVVELGANLGVLESDIQAALSALIKKEEDLQDAERRVYSENSEKDRAMKELLLREKELVAARVKQEKLEEELRVAGMDLTSQAGEIVELKTRLKERDLVISDARSTLLGKERELSKIENELIKKTEEAAVAESEFSSKAMLLKKANDIVATQEVEIQNLQRSLEAKEKELEVSRSMYKHEFEKAKVSERNLEKQTMDWFLVQGELKKLFQETSKHVEETNGTMKEFGRVTKLLSDVRSELVLSQKALASARERMDGHGQLLDTKITELEELRKRVTSYMVSLREAKLELQSERVKLRSAVAQKEKLERDLSLEKELVGELQKELEKERLSLKEATRELSALKEEVDHKRTIFDETQILLQAKEFELVEGRLEIQHLRSEQTSLQLLLKEKDLELLDAGNRLKGVQQETSELKRVLMRREEELVQAASVLKEKDENAQTMRYELNTAKQKYSDAERLVEHIVDLTKEAVLSINDESFYALSPLDNTNAKLPVHLPETQADSLKWQREQLKAELEITRETLKAKEVEVLSMQRALNIKNEELKTVLRNLDTKEKEIAHIKEDLVRDKDDLERLYSLAQERIGGKTVGDLAIEKLEIEAAQLEVEAATNALQKITEMSRELLNRASLSNKAYSEVDLRESNSSGFSMNGIIEIECSRELKSEVSRLLSFTEQLVRDASISGDAFG